MLSKYIPLALLCAIALSCLAAVTIMVSEPAYANEPRILQAIKTVDVGSLVDAAGETETITVPGAALGDACVASFAVDVLDMTVTCYIQAANAVEVRVQNESGSTANLASTTMRVFIFKRSPT